MNKHLSACGIQSKMKNKIVLTFWNLLEIIVQLTYFNYVTCFHTFIYLMFFTKVQYIFCFLEIVQIWFRVTHFCL